jgi:hypothetical protein
MLLKRCSRRSVHISCLYYGIVPICCWFAAHAYYCTDIPYTTDYGIISHKLVRWLVSMFWPFDCTLLAVTWRARCMYTEPGISHDRIRVVRACIYYIWRYIYIYIYL